MSTFDSPRATPRTAAAQTVFTTAAGLLTLLLCAAGVGAQAQSARFRQQQQSKESESAMRQAKPAPAPTLNEDEESESVDEEERTRPRVTDPAALMRTARVVYVRSLTAFVNAREVEDSLRKRKEFRAWGMSITRDEGEADLIVEVARKSLSRRFTFTVVEPRTMAVVTSGKTRSVLFGKKIPNKIAEKFANRFRAVRPYPAP